MGQVDPDRLRSFVDDEYPRVVAAVTLVCGDPLIAQDAVQEALVRACEHLERGGELANLAAWVTTVASNHTRTGFRRLGREQRAVERLATSGDHEATGVSAAAERIVLHDAIRALPERQRLAVVLRYFVGLDVASVAAEMDIADGTVKALLHQARRSLAERLDDGLDVGDDETSGAGEPGGADETSGEVQR